MKSIRLSLVLTSMALVFGAGVAVAQTITLKVHHFLPAASTTQAQLIQPWCDRIARESQQRIKCQIYPSMQLGGTPAQLIDQVRDGVADVIWTLPGYSAGRFPMLEVFELPFMMRGTEATSRAVWDFMQQDGAAELRDVHPLAIHVHSAGAFHLSKRPIQTMADLRGLKLRAPTRQTNRLLAALGATPVAMPVPQVSEAIAKSVIDGALLPYEVVPSVKIQELVKFHSETDPAEPAIYTSTCLLAMNKARYDSLPPDLRRVIDAASGAELSAMAGRVFEAADEPGRKLTQANAHNRIAPAELQRWKAAAQSVSDAWVADMQGRGGDGRALLAKARGLIARYASN